MENKVLANGLKPCRSRKLLRRCGMGSRGVLITVVTFVGTLGLLASLSTCSSRSVGHLPAQAHQQIQHVVVIFQENRTPDNLFQDPVIISRGADIANTGINSQGQVIPLTKIGLNSNFDLDHSHHAFVEMYDGGKMDGANLIRTDCTLSRVVCPPNPQFTYVNPSDVQPYFQLAEQYTFGDRMFQTNQGPSFPAHQFLISGTSAPTATSDLFAAENLVGGRIAGCIALRGTTVALIDPQGKESSTQYPCFEHPTLTDLLDSNGISWRYYAPSAGSIWTGPDAIQHICQAQSLNGQLTCTGKPWSNVIIPETQVLTDIANNQLANVTWVIPRRPSSDHPGSGNRGPSWVGSIVNAIGNSPYWNHTVIFISWDDWGGWYDHVAPAIVNSYEYGFRVPLIVVSPYAKHAYISHVTHNTASFLKFIEELHTLPSLGYADAQADDLSDCFDFTQTPAPFQTIPTALGADFFLSDPTPPSDPDDD